MALRQYEMPPTSTMNAYSSTRRAKRRTAALLRVPVPTKTDAANTATYAMLASGGAPNLKRQPHHPGEQGGNRHLLAVPCRRTTHGKTTPGQRQHASVQGRAADGAAGHLGGAAIPKPETS